MLTVVINPKKRSAGFLVIAGRRLLLLERSRGSGNGGTWGLPGGQMDPDESIYAAALRESVEELRGLPRHAVVGSAAVQRGARRYEVLACRVRKRARKRWVPRLNREHVDYRWAKLSWCRAHRDALHPVVGALLDDRGGRQWLRRMIERPTPKRLPGGRRATDGVRRAA